MKKLIALLFAGVTTLTFGFETEPFKYIPKGEYIIFYDMNGNGKYDMFWWDKNKDGKMQNNERFYDLNEDGIPDISYEEIIKLYENRFKGTSI